MNAQPRVAARPAEERAANHGSSDRGKPAGAPLTQDAWRVYKRLLGYARPHLGMFMIGVVGMLLFAASDAALVWLVKEFFKGAFVKPDPRTLAIAVRVEDAAGDAVAVGVEHHAGEEEADAVGVAPAHDRKVALGLDEAVDEDLGGAGEADGGAGVARFDEAEDLDVTLGIEDDRARGGGSEGARAGGVGVDGADGGEREAEDGGVAAGVDRRSAARPRS